MKLVMYLFILVLYCSSCENPGKARMLEEKEKLLIQKEQDLTLREQSLQLREAQLLIKEQVIDSASRKHFNDSLLAMRPPISGTWSVKMTCTETTCPSSAVGDTKTEQWEISAEENLFIAKSISNNKTGRIYAGKYVGDFLELTAIQDSTEAGRSTQMVVRLQHAKENEMEGQRQITRGEECKIIYTMLLKRQL